MNNKDKRPYSLAISAPEIPLTVHDVQEALEERIAKGIYARGQRLPPVRSIAAEFGTSPSTVSRALGEMTRDGWLEVQERQYVRVRYQITPRKMRGAQLQRTIRALAHKWKLQGGTKDELLETIRGYIGEVFASEPQFIFAECNQDDLNYMGDQLEKELSPLPIVRSLLSELSSKKLHQGKSVILVPYYHYAEVKNLVGRKFAIVPVHSTASVETLDELLTIPRGSRVLVVGHNERSVARLTGMVQDYIDAQVTGVTFTQSGTLAKLAAEADVIVAVRSAMNQLGQIKGIKKLIPVRFELDTSLSRRLKNGTLDGLNIGY